MIGNLWADIVKMLPVYSEIIFAANGTKPVHGMVRDMPGQFPRRVTVLDTGTEFFVEADTEFEHFEITTTGDWPDLG